MSRRIWACKRSNRCIEITLLVESAFSSMDGLNTIKGATKIHLPLEPNENIRFLDNITGKSSLFLRHVNGAFHVARMDSYIYCFPLLSCFDRKYDSIFTVKKKSHTHTKSTEIFYAHINCPFSLYTAKLENSISASIFYRFAVCYFVS